MILDVVFCYVLGYAFPWNFYKCNAYEWFIFMCYMCKQAVKVKIDLNLQILQTFHSLTFRKRVFTPIEKSQFYHFLGYLF